MDRAFSDQQQFTDGLLNDGGLSNDLGRAAISSDLTPDSPATAQGLVSTITPADTGTGSISLTTTGSAYTQDFNTLSNTAGSTTNTALPVGWYITETGGGARDNEQYAVDTGGSTTGDIYSYGTAGSTERALGEERSGTLIPLIGGKFTNNTGGTIGSLNISYDGEQWRFGGVHSTVPDKMDFQISFNATDLSTGTWIDVNALDFNPPVTAGSAGALDGNAAANHTSISAIISSLNIPDGATFWIRWVDQDATGADDGLAIDNFSITASAAAPSPGSLTVADVSAAEGNSGDTDMVFTVTRAGGTAGAVSADYTISFGTADAGDFGAGFSSTGTVNFADGATAAQIHVPVHGDTSFEPDETFSVTLSNPTGGATLGAHLTATGTITNDDAAPAGTLNLGDATVAEGNSGDTDMVFVVSRDNGSAGAVSATWTITLGSGTGHADASDFGAGYTSTGTVSFADGATTAEIHVPIHGDTTFEPNEDFTVTLSAPTGGVALGDAVGVGTITNDDPTPPPANVYINEIHYDNGGTDTGEAIEIAGTAGTDLSGYKLVMYDGTSPKTGAATVYNTVNLTGTIDDEGSGYGAVVFNFGTNGIQNGANDGIALIAPDGTVIQLLSYEGTFTAAAGTPAAGMTSTDIGVLEDGSGPVGQSLQLTGHGASYADFTWVSDSTSSFGSLNSGQVIIPDSATGDIRVSDAQVVEGNSGTSNLVFTVYRAGGLGSSASVDYAINLDGTATSDDLGAGAVLSGTVNFAVGAHSATITVPIQGDTVGETNETLSLDLTNPQGNITVSDDHAVGTIINDDPVVLTISQIQGAGHTSSYVGQPVSTTGIVTAVDTNGFYMQSAVGDGNSATSDAIFVFTSTAPTVNVGDGVTVGATVSEFAGDAQGLTTTELNSPTVTVTSTGNALPDAIVIGEHGILPPTQVLDDDHLTSYDPTHDGLDFWESLEGMRVTIETPQAVANTNTNGETFVVASHGDGATGMNDRGGITISPNGDGTIDYNPERIIIDDDSGVYSGFHPNYTVGDQLSDVTGILNYAFDSYRVTVTDPVTVTSDVTLAKETSTLHGDANHLSIATYNLENLDASDHKYDILASDMVYNLQAPDIIAVQEIQDADGAGSGSDLSGTTNAQGLIDAIYSLTGLHYAYIEIAPTTPNSTGGEPNGNIRNGYLYNTDRVSYVAGSAELITGSAYNGSRNPLVAQWQFNGQTLTTINVHLTSRGGSDPLEGDNQPATDAGDASRTAQAAGVKAYIESHLATDPSLNIAVLGDWNGFYFEPAQTQLTDPAQGGHLTNLNVTLPAQERYSYLFDGNAQQIDNILVTGGLLSGASYDSVHLNSQFGDTRPTDHDPQLALLFFSQQAVAVDDSNAVIANATIANGSVVANDHDPDGPALEVSAVNGSSSDVGTQIVLASGALLTLRSDGTYDYDPNHAFDSLTGVSGAANSSATDSFTYALANGNTATVTITVSGAPGSGQPATGTSGNDTMTGTANTDIFNLSQGGSDHASGGGGNDGFYMGAALDAGDVLDGGSGSLDQVGLQGDYSGGLTLGANSLTGIEQLVFLAGSDTRFGDPGTNLYSYVITTDDGNVAAGQQLVVQANALLAGESLTFNGSAETDGSFLVYAGLGSDHLTGGQQNDAFYFGVGRFGAGDSVDGQGGTMDQLGLQGDYSGANAVHFGSGQISNIEMIVLLSGADTRFNGGGSSFSYTLVMDDANAAAGSLMTVQANTLRAGEVLTLDASAEHDASYRVYGGAGDDHITGGDLGDELWGNAGSDTLIGRGGADQLHGGAGNDTFVYQALTDSTTTAQDHIFDFAGGDTIDVAATGLFDFHSGGFTHSAGEVIATYTGSTWLIQGDSDGDGVADLSIQVDQASSYAWSAADFHLAPAPNALVLPIDSVTSNDMLVVSMDVLSSGQPAPAGNDTDTFGLHHLMLDHVSQPGYDHIV